MTTLAQPTALLNDVLATTLSGPLAADDAGGGFWAFEWWQWLLILVLIGLIVMLVVMRRKGRE